jgi:hypothetical protein
VKVAAALEYQAVIDTRICDALAEVAPSCGPGCVALVALLLCGVSKANGEKDLPLEDSIRRLLPSVSGELLTDGFKREKDFFRSILSLLVPGHLIAIPMGFRADLSE